jgi:pyruvate/2-oxoglutarate dehydrogenase complex dihydrolipoamide acyltransferase (E2) component
MARKILNRKELREENDTAERAAAAQPKAAAKKAPVKRKSRAKVVKEVRLKAFWGVFNQSMRRLALFEYSQRKEADKKAADLTESQKSPHFVQIVKEVIEE